MSKMAEINIIKTKCNLFPFFVHFGVFVNSAFGSKHKLIGIWYDVRTVMAAPTRTE